jgi:hypothetical protein
VSTRDIRTSQERIICDVCGRTLLRGERADPYIAGAERRLVCELCKTRAVHEGWVREGSVPALRAYPAGTERGGSLFSRLLGRPRRDRPRPRPLAAEPPGGWLEEDGEALEGIEAGGIMLTPPLQAPRARPAPTGLRRRDERHEDGLPRVPRHVHAVPTGEAQKIAAAVELFNLSEHSRTVASVARSLGQPGVNVAPVPGHAGLVRLVVAWELCWYRYELDLSEDDPHIIASGQGYELDELEPAERVANARADERGQLSLQ